MKEEFTYGELVEVRDHAGQKWQKCVYVGTFPNTNPYWCMSQGQDETNYDGQPVKWNQIRKIQLEPQPEQQTPEQVTMAYLQGQIERLSQRIYKLESELNIHSVT